MVAGGHFATIVARHEQHSHRHTGLPLSRDGRRKQRRWAELNTYRAAFDARAHGGPWLVEWWKGGVFKGYIADGFASEIDAQSVVVALAIAEVKRI